MFWNIIIYIGITIVRFPLMISYRVFGKDNLPAEGPFIIVVNHSSVMDTGLTFFVAPWYQRIFFAAKTWEKTFFLGWGMKKGGAIYINRGNVDRKAMGEALSAIKQGKIFGMAPEGTRSSDGRLAKGRDGAVYLATKSGAPVIPVGIVNANKWRDNIRRLRWTHLEAHVGKPLVMPELDRPIRSRDLPAYTHYVMVHIAHQLPEYYWGVYANSPALQALQQGVDPWPHCLIAENVLSEASDG
ncbi:MAG: 1-acyl-sn-glycerol-3-phosphate acyltransferase [Cellvibrionaceae bacterium]|jgi:1-acyl-sn-glycerol-3-phosphate acyltransferase